MLPGLCQATDFAGVIQQAGNWAVAISDLLQVCQPECQPDEKAKTWGFRHSTVIECLND